MHGNVPDKMSRGGAGGAEKMIRDGVLENPAVSAIAALHVGTEIEGGKIGRASCRERV